MRTKFRAAGLVAAVYGYFLIFAQFALVELLRDAGIPTAGERLALGLMAVAGVAAGFLVAARGAQASTIRAGFLLAALAGGLAPWMHGFAGLLTVAILCGLALGGVTVAVAALLPRWCGVAWVGLGTGAGYALCNFPVVFAASPAVQSWAGAAMAVAGALLVPAAVSAESRQAAPAAPSVALPGRIAAAVIAFLALVWLDSSAFFIIQHEHNFKAATWGDAMLWRNATLHLVAAVAAGWWLNSRPWKPLLVVAWVVLAIAALAVNDAATRTLAGWWYPVGVSLYSTALVAWPAFLSGVGDVRRAAWRAAWVFGVAGWLGSANGIGMAESLQRVPAGLIIASGIAVIAAAVTGFRWRSVLALGLVAGTAAAFTRDGGDPPDAVSRGRAVYLAEGCIACHSRYVRPSDPTAWGPPSDPAVVLTQQPVLIGNRRQGPDLSHVGARRSAAWLREHFIAPRKLVKDSTMPGYAHLFEDERGEDLIAWLMEDQGDALAWRIEQSKRWKPGGSASGDGAALFGRHCVTCHGAGGRGDGELAGRLAVRPANLVEGPFSWTPDRAALARVVKWGIPGTDMPGHELLDDDQVLALADWVQGLRE